jgi:hypothetical protein
MTGIRIAHTRGGKKACSGWPSSTNGYERRRRERGCQMGGLTRGERALCREWWGKNADADEREGEATHYQQRPDGVVAKHKRGGHQHREPDERGGLGGTC